MLRISILILNLVGSELQCSFSGLTQIRILEDGITVIVRSPVCVMVSLDSDKVVAVKQSLVVGQVILYLCGKPGPGNPLPWG
jgi:hypothetical protein